MNFSCNLECEHCQRKMQTFIVHQQMEKLKAEKEQLAKELSRSQDEVRKGGKPFETKIAELENTIKNLEHPFRIKMMELEKSIVDREIPFNKKITELEVLLSERNGFIEALKQDGWVEKYEKMIDMEDSIKRQFDVQQTIFDNSVSRLECEAELWRKKGERVIQLDQENEELKEQLIQAREQLRRVNKMSTI